MKVIAQTDISRPQLPRGYRDCFSRFRDGFVVHGSGRRDVGMTGPVIVRSANVTSTRAVYHLFYVTNSGTIIFRIFVICSDTHLQYLHQFPKLYNATESNVKAVKHVIKIGCILGNI